ncbi:MAG: GNAT family N-acetyltransferase [Pseudomonadota bacterium]
MTRVSVRPAQLDDAAVISDLVLALTPVFFDDPDAALPEPVRASLLPDGCRARLADPAYTSWVAMCAGELVGYAALHERRHVYHLFVAEAHHRQGVARALWSALRAACHPGPITVRSSRAAVPVYRRFGFVERGALETKLGLTFQPMVLDPGSADAP